MSHELNLLREVRILSAFTFSSEAFGLQGRSRWFLSFKNYLNDKSCWIIHSSRHLRRHS
ncbi:hypothetical protein CCHR01_07790 [Colletotrichum chrysophilum]|uniref:Uncharacterized protein n=1 Tax=Colletotrichum chrysophilum TaxID=1836956 RepID=A0AAD9AKV9_9PEZI|nr:hypothetical protein CCHR01_07790 [Colletotrichum chrysophilum]